LSQHYGSTVDGPWSAIGLRIASAFADGIVNCARCDAGLSPLESGLPAAVEAAHLTGGRKATAEATACRRQAGQKILSEAVDKRKIRRTLRAPMNHQSTHDCTRRRLALNGFAGIVMNPYGAPPRALEIEMR
jgi:hypothetical protein